MCKCVFSSLGYVPKSRNAESYGSSVFYSFLRETSISELSGGKWALPLEMHWTHCNSLVIPQKSKYIITTRPSNSTPGYIPKRTENKILKQLVVNVYKALITKAKRWKHRCPVIDE